MRKLIVACQLQILAFALAVLRLLGGVLTDEAKYLLNIPYPHPPLVRYVLHLSTAIPEHELLLRIVFATLLVQSMWLIHWALRETQHRVRWTACALWLGSAAVILQAGTIMMSPLTALFGLVLVMAFVMPMPGKRQNSLWIFGIAVLWLASLFTAYQAVLYVPLLVGVLRRLGATWRETLIYVLTPMIALTAYSLANPLSLGSMLLVAGKGEGVSLLHRLSGAAWLWWVAGSGVLTILGVGGALLSKKWEVLATMGLLLAYVVLTDHPYYAILMTPALLAGAILWLKHASHFSHRSLIAPVVACLAVWIFALSTLGSPQSLWPMTNTARDTLMLASHSSQTPLLIVGAFGHEWQYYWPSEVIRYTPSLKAGRADAAFKVCFIECPFVLGTGGMLMLSGYN